MIIVCFTKKMFLFKMKQQFSLVLEVSVQTGRAPIERKEADCFPSPRSVCRLLQTKGSAFKNLNQKKNGCKEAQMLNVRLLKSYKLT